MIDILLATYNGEFFLKDLIDSLVGQTFRDWKLVIRDDGSQDKTKEILLSYKEKYPDKISTIEDQKENLGVTQNFSELIKASKTDYIMFCDQDDVWLPEKIECTFAAMKEMESQFGDEPILVHTDLKIVDENLNPLSNSLWKYLKINPELNSLNRHLMQNTVTGCTTMINRRLADLAAPIPEYVYMYDLWLALVASSFGKIRHIDKQTILYRQHEKNTVGIKNRFRLSPKRMKNIFRPINYRRSIAQASCFLEKYKDRLSEEQVALLMNFCLLPQFNFLKKRFVILKYGFFKQRMLRNISILLKI